MNRRQILVVDLDAFKALQLLHTRLNLIALRRLVTEFLDEFLRLLDQPLLVRISSLLLRNALLAKLNVLRIRNLVVVKTSQHHLNRTSGAIVKKTTVVGDQHQRTGKTALQIVLKPLDRLNVKMVRGLVEQKHVGTPEQNLGKLYAHVPSLRESLGLSREFVLLEAQSGKGTLDRFFGRIRLSQHKSVVHLVKLNDKPMISLGLIVSPVGELKGNLVDPAVQLLKLVIHRHHLFDHSPTLVVLHDLRKIADALVGGAGDLSGSGTLQIHDKLEHSALSRSVLADQAYAVTIANMQADRIQQRKASVGDSDVIERNHAKASSSFSSSSASGSAFLHTRMLMP